MILLATFVAIASGLFATTRIQERLPAKSPAVVLITSSGCRSAETRTVGTFIDRRLIVSVAHGVAGQTRNEITTLDGEKFNARVVAIDVRQDLALLAIDPMPPSLKFEPVVLGKPKGGEDVYFFAFDDDSQFVRAAKIRRRLRIDTEDIYLREKVSRPGLEVELSVKVGNSGGPLVNKTGELVGLVWSTSRVVADRSWATRAEAIESLVATAVNYPPTHQARPVACTG